MVGLKIDCWDDMVLLGLDVDDNTYGEFIVNVTLGRIGEFIDDIILLLLLLLLILLILLLLSLTTLSCCCCYRNL